MKKKNNEYIENKESEKKGYKEKNKNKIYETVWADRCGSWYKTEEGKIVNNYPGYGIEYHWMMARPDYSDFKNNLKSNT